MDDATNRISFSAIVEGSGGLTLRDREATLLQILTLERASAPSTPLGLFARKQTDDTTQVYTEALSPGKHILTIAKAVSIEGETYDVVAVVNRPGLADPYRRVFYAESRPSVLFVVFDPVIKEINVLFSEQIKLGSGDAAFMSTSSTGDAVVLGEASVNNASLGVRLPDDFDMDSRVVLSFGDIYSAHSPEKILEKPFNPDNANASKELELLPSEHTSLETAWRPLVQ